MTSLRGFFCTKKPATNTSVAGSLKMRNTGIRQVFPIRRNDRCAPGHGLLSTAAGRMAVGACLQPRAACQPDILTSPAKGFRRPPAKSRRRRSAATLTVYGHPSGKASRSSRPRMRICVRPANRQIASFKKPTLVGNWHSTKIRPCCQPTHQDPSLTFLAMANNFKQRKCLLLKDFSQFFSH